MPWAEWRVGLAWGASPRNCSLYKTVQSEDSYFPFILWEISLSLCLILSRVRGQSKLSSLETHTSNRFRLSGTAPKEESWFRWRFAGQMNQDTKPTLFMHPTSDLSFPVLKPTERPSKDTKQSKSTLFKFPYQVNNLQRSLHIKD